MLEMRECGMGVSGWAMSGLGSYFLEYPWLRLDIQCRLLAMLTASALKELIRVKFDNQQVGMN